MHEWVVSTRLFDQTARYRDRDTTATGLRGWLFVTGESKDGCSRPASVVTKSKHHWVDCLLKLWSCTCHASTHKHPLGTGTQLPLVSARLAVRYWGVKGWLLKTCIGGDQVQTSLNGLPSEALELYPSRFDTQTSTRDRDTTVTGLRGWLLVTGESKDGCSRPASVVTKSKHHWVRQKTPKTWRQKSWSILRLILITEIWLRITRGGIKRRILI